MDYRSPTPRIWINPSPMGRGAQAWIIKYVDGKEFILNHGTYEWVEVPNNEDYPPTLRLTDENAQEIMDQLYRCGFRPQGGRQSEGRLSAIEKHLEDMRTLTFDKLGVTKP